MIDQSHPEPKLNRAVHCLEDLGLDVIVLTNKHIRFFIHGSRVDHYIKMEWSSGKCIRDCRGFNHLINQVKQKLKSFKRLTDETTMPWGKHKDVALEDVPASYLFWLEDQIRRRNNNDSFRSGLLVYIEENRDVLNQE